jgi:hypothetical protein
MKSKNDISIDYLYKQNPHKNSLYDGDDIMFEFLFLDEKKEMENFLNNSALADLVFLLIRAFRNKYPNFLELTSVLAGDGKSQKKGNIDIDTDPPKTRKDIKEFEWHYFLNNKFGETYYLQKAVFHFANTESKENLISAIKEALEGNSYTETNGVFEVTDSPIKQITVTNWLFELVVNDEKVIYYF